MNNQNEITVESGFDIVSLMTHATGADCSTQVPLYRKHRDQIDRYIDNRELPESFVLGIVSNNLMLVVHSAVVRRELDGMLGALVYLMTNANPAIYGSHKSASDHLQGNTDIELARRSSFK